MSLSTLVADSPGLLVPLIAHRSCVADAAELEKAIAAAQTAVTEQGDNVRALKAGLKSGTANKVRSRPSPPECRSISIGYLHGAGTSR